MSAELFTPAGGRAPYTGGRRERQWREPCVLRAPAAQRRRVPRGPDRGQTMADYAQARRAMVDSQVRPHDVTDLRIIAALLEVPRERFFPEVKRALAYLDAEVPVAGTRALLKPMVFAKLLQAAGIADGERVLDIGCASGYSSAVLG